jgi:hypothetical protein
MPDISKIKLSNGTTYDIKDATARSAADTKVTQNNSTDNADYRVLLSKSANDTTETDETNKNASLTYNPSKKKLTLGSRNEVFTTGSTNMTVGRYCQAYSDYSMAVGYEAKANGDYSVAMGNETSAKGRSQFVFGEYNELDNNGSKTAKGDYVEIVGNGTGTSARSNARTLDWSGNEVLAGSLTTTDVVRNAKWDGTNTSLATAITSLNSTLSGNIANVSFGNDSITFLNIGKVVICECAIDGHTVTLASNTWTYVAPIPSNIPRFLFLSVPLVNGGTITFRCYPGTNVIQYLYTGAAGNVWFQGSGATIADN